MISTPSKAAVRRDAISRWWARGPWPCVLFTVDTGRVAGAALTESRPGGAVLRWARSVQTYSRDVEATVREAFAFAESIGLPLVTLLEDWGRGGPLGIDQWIGMGEARGVWRREVVLQAADSPMGAKGRIAAVPQSRWRSRMVPEAGFRTEGAWRPFDPDEWKEAAQRAAMIHFPDTNIPPRDAAEAACIAAYGIRSDEVVSHLSETHLDRWGIPVEDRELLEPLIARPRKKGR